MPIDLKNKQRIEIKFGGMFFHLTLENISWNESLEKVTRARCSSLKTFLMMCCREEKGRPLEQDNLKDNDL
jgi:hypothetical protein